MMLDREKENYPMKTMNEITKCKNAVARAAGTVARIKIELRLAEMVLAQAEHALDKAIDQSPVVRKPGTSIYITASGPEKISLIKAVREIANLGLKQAKDVVDAAGPPSEANRVLADPAKMQEAIRLLKAAGATVEVM